MVYALSWPRRIWLASWLLALPFLHACGPAAPIPYQWSLPQGFPPVPVPADNPMTAAKVALGRHLFYDDRLSTDGSLSCGSCHEQQRAFADGKATPKGFQDAAIPRNSMGLANVGYYVTYTWGNPVLTSLEQQLLVPLFSDAPPELNISHNTQEVLQRLADAPRYQALFAQAYPDVPAEKRVTSHHIIQALACFLRTMVSGDAPFDRFQRGDKDALSPLARQGWALFQSTRFGCRRCHDGPFFSTATAAKGLSFKGSFFHNTGLYNVGGAGDYPFPNTGLFEFTQKPQDMGKFRIPSLRNVGVTAPYMHDGSVATLKGVLDHYAAGGRTVKDGPNAGDGSQNPHKSQEIKARPMTPAEADALIAFLHSLTDRRFLENPAFSNPF